MRKSRKGQANLLIIEPTGVLPRSHRTCCSISTCGSGILWPAPFTASSACHVFWSRHWLAKADWAERDFSHCLRTTRLPGWHSQSPWTAGLCTSESIATLADHGILQPEIPVRRMASERNTKLNDALVRILRRFLTPGDSDLTRLAWPVSSRQPPCLSRTWRWPRPHSQWHYYWPSSLDDQTCALQEFLELAKRAPVLGLMSDVDRNRIISSKRILIATVGSAAEMSMRYSTFSNSCPGFGLHLWMKVSNMPIIMKLLHLLPFSSVCSSHGR